MESRAYDPNAAPRSVAERLLTWHDAARLREVPARLYAPAEACSPAPVVLFSHGLGSSREGYSYLGRHWAARGYVAVHLTHRGSDAEALRGPGGLPPRGLSEYFGDVDLRWNRARDFSFTLDELAREPALAKRLDLSRVAAAGHSAGAWTALSAVGLIAEMPPQGRVRFSDARVRAAIALSPQSEGRLGICAASWSAIDRPVLSITGTRDYELGLGTAAGRRHTFDGAPAPDQYLLTIQGATHATFDDPKELRVPSRQPDPRHHAWVCAATTAFLDAYLRKEPAALEWLLSRSIESASRGACCLEYKRV